MHLFDEAKLVCDVCGKRASVTTRHGLPKPEWLALRYSLRGWVTTHAADGARHDTCPACVVASQAVTP